MASNLSLVLCLMVMLHTVTATFPPVSPPQTQDPSDWLVAYKPGSAGTNTKRFLTGKGATVKKSLKVAGYEIDVVGLPPGLASHVEGSNSGRGPPPAVLQEILAKYTDEVQYVEPDSIMTIAVRSLADDIPSPPEMDAVESTSSGVATNGLKATAVQSGLRAGLWGLDRLDQVNLPLSSSYSYNDTAGQGVTVYVLDTGIVTNHVEFTNRTIPVKSFIEIKGKRGRTLDVTDGNGHGTHCAGTVGGISTGVAKKVSLVAVKVLSDSGSGTNSGVIAGINYVTQAGQCPAGSGKKCIISMSLGGTFSQALNDAVNAADAAGVLVVVAAGNSGNTYNACGDSPAGASGAFTVGATGSLDSIASFSSNGACVDVLAPGVSIYSSWFSGTTSYKTISGTSMATPHVAGLAALYWADGSYTVADLKAKLIATASNNLISGNLGASPNRLARYQQF